MRKASLLLGRTKDASIFSLNTFSGYCTAVDFVLLDTEIKSRKCSFVPLSNPLLLPLTDVMLIKRDESCARFEATKFFGAAAAGISYFTKVVSFSIHAKKSAFRRGELMTKRHLVRIMTEKPNETCTRPFETLSFSRHKVQIATTHSQRISRMPL